MGQREDLPGNVHQDASWDLSGPESLQHLYWVAVRAALLLLETLPGKTKSSKELQEQGGSGAHHCPWTSAGAIVRGVHG